MSETERKLRVFLCHSSSDKPTVRDLYHRLDAEGWMDVWLDEVKLFPGQDWNFEIERAVEEADVILVCLTKNSVNKEGYVQRELRIVLDLADYKPEGTLFVIPVRLEECDPPRRLRSWQYADYFPKENRDAAYQRLLVSLRMRAKRIGVSTVNPAEEKARREAEESARRQAEELKRRQAEEDARQEKEALDRKAAQDRARKESEERAARQKAEEERLTKAKAEIERKAKEKADHLAAQKDEAGGEGDQSKPGIKAERVGSIPQRKVVGERIAAWLQKPNLRPYGIGTGILLIVVLGIFGINSLIQTINAKETATPTFTQPPPLSTNTSVPPTRTQGIPMNTATLAHTPVSTLGIGSTMISPKDSMVLVYVPAGEFQMGSEDGEDDEKPVHTVYLDAFWIDKTEVTNAMYAVCVKDGECEAPRLTKSYTVDSYYGNTEYDNYPVIYVSWDDANAYCSWADRRLPTEAEWEKAARGEDAFTYPWGNELPSNYLLNYNKTVGDTTNVSAYPNSASPYGALNMAGNVWEWVSSLYQSYPYDATDGREDLGKFDIRVLRGGSQGDSANFVRSADRGRNSSDYFYLDLGFRCAQSAAFGIGSIKISETDGMKMVYVPAGEFKMGSESGADSEKPVHTVYLEAFWIDQTEVTNSMYAKCVAVGRCGLPFKSSSYTRESYYGNVEFDNYPVIDVNWYNASLYCEWAGRRLPTEAEWEKAAGWDDGKQRMYVYPWGNSINCTLANFGNSKDDGCVGDTTKVGSYLNGKSSYGVLDMAGNVLEWVSDWYDEKYYSISPVSNPLGPDSGQYRVFRGGSWDHQSSSQRVSWRGFWDPSSAWSNDGIRCAISASK